ncbi:MAG TPA: alpha-galactosidase [Chloroflexota bacterium]|nr:alpha-galactosidase [Chloroflexota bacterium]
MAKVTLVGAGSGTFARRLITDILSWPELADSEFALMDIDPERLGLIHDLTKKMIAEKGTGARVQATTDRATALEGADYVITTIAVGFQYGADRPEVQIPERYGLHQTVADTLGVGGVFRYLRTMPAMLEVGLDMQRLCPQALWLNYVNPMNMIMRTINRALPGLRNVGLCHSIQHTSEQLAGYIGVPHEELAYWVAGINHQAWFLQLRHRTYRGEDLYPRLRAAMEQPATEEQDRVRFAVLRHFGYFVTESSRHMSEYVPWFRRTGADRDRYTPAPGNRPTAGPPPTAQSRRAAMWEQVRQQIAGQTPIDYGRSREYCSSIIHAIEANAPFRFNGNVPNSGLIANLPPACSVEVPILVDNTGLHPCHVGDLPPQLAAVNRTNVNVHELAAEGFLQRDRAAVFQACAVDPLTSASVAIDDIQQMVDELFTANARWLDGYEASATRAAG